MLFGDVGLGDVGCDLGYLCAAIRCHLQVIFRTDPWKKQYRELSPLDHRGGRFEQLQFRLLRKTVRDRGPSQSVSVGNFDHLDSSVIQTASYSTDLFRSKLVTQSMTAVS